ncbi:MAG: SIMPL domain-containing protein, partial [Ignavibacteria bacterium]|nr:SIMPL domain-containing protein [Ignavibacteria bacterium]
MKRNIFVVLASLLIVGSLVACSTTPAAAGNAPVVRTLSSSGTGEIYLVPDVAYIYVGVRADAEDVSTALNKNNAQANAVAQALKDQGLEAKDIQTTSFNVYPMQDYGMDGTISRSYYVVENTVYITVHDLTKLGALLDAVVKSGANTINSISFDVQDKADAMAQARDLAIANARAEAEAIAKASGVKLGDLQYVSAYTNNIPTPMYDAKGGS